jgi:predicted DNA-binding transcriptional regulator AlpA
MRTYYTDRKLAERYDIHRLTIWRWVRSGKFPPPIKIVGSTRWLSDDVLAWEKSTTKK